MSGVKDTVRRWFRVTSVPVLLALALLGGIRALTTHWDATEWSEHAGDVRIAITRLTDLMVDAETGDRGYLLTGDRAFLRAHDDAVASWRSRLDDVRVATQASTTQQQNVATLERIIPDKLEQLSDMVKARDIGQGSEIWRLQLGRNMLADLRRVGATMQSEQERLVTARVEAARRHVHDSLVLFVTSSVALMVLVGFVWVRRARAEERAAAFERLVAEREASIRFADEFIAILGHDLRNPLGAMTMGGKLLLQTLTGGDREIAQRIVSSGERMLRMIEQILELARSRVAGGIPVAAEPMNATELVTNVVNELRTAHPDRRIDWVHDDDIIGIWDADALSHMVSNLVGNAIIHGERTHPVSVHLGRVDDHVELDVHNDGPPIDEALLPKLFEPYGHGRSRTKSRGLGLGLFIAHEIARAHGGDIHVRSSAAEGTTVTVVLPRVNGMTNA
jgi:signal transduction histidine kinase